jgi:outer membrane protein OmpA-like peptidoglycan-associated protein
MRALFRLSVGGSVLLLTLVAGCAQPLSTGEKGVLAGGGLGAATGAIIGAEVGNPGAGAAIGGALGGLGGGLVGDQLQQHDLTLADQRRALDQQRQELARNRELLEDLRRRNLEAAETERGIVVNFPDVLFEFGQARLTPEARSKTRDMAQIFTTQARDRRIAVEGHTDAIGSDSFNQALSEQRADQVASALIADGVNPQQIMSEGYGERYPIAANMYQDGLDNPQGRQKNRRVEVVVENRMKERSPS